MSSLNALIAILGWAPMAVVLFAVLPPRRAAIGGAIGAWLLLPPIVIDLPGFPDYGKSTAATVGILIGTAIFESHRLFSFRVRWFDMPIILFCITPLLSSLSNDLGVYDGLSGSFQQMVRWFFPYLIGRLYLTDLDAMREMAMGILIGGLWLLPLVLFEMRMSPRLMQDIYGVGNWEGAIRFGGYRPRVFFTSGLELGLWMSAVSLVAWLLWRGESLRRIAGVPGGVVVATLFVVTLLCRSTGSTVLLFLAMAALWTSWRFQSKKPMWALLWAAPIYCALRVSQLWSGDQIVALSRILINESRARSLEYRLINDEILIAKMFQQPFFGWGGFGRSLVYDEYGRVLSVPDGMWIAYLSSLGLLGLFLMTTSVLVPASMFIRRFPITLWRHPSVVPAIAICGLVCFMLLDGLFNGMLNLIYIIGAGGLANLGALPGNSRVLSDAQGEGEETELARPLTRSSRHDVSTPAARLRGLGIALKAEGRIAEAKRAWERALALLTPYSTSWCDLANDLAWLLANTPDLDERDPARAVELGRSIVQVHPKSPTYWNTLGAALHRQGDHELALAALEEAIQHSQGGTPFDFLFLAMAHARRGEHEQASLALDKARSAMAKGPTGNPSLTLLYEEALSLLESHTAAT